MRRERLTANQERLLRACLGDERGRTVIRRGEHQAAYALQRRMWVTTYPDDSGNMLCELVSSEARAQTRTALEGCDGK